MLRGSKYLMVSLTALIMFSLVLSGCAVNFYKYNPRSKKEIKDLKAKISDLERERAQFEEAKRMLEDKLRGQISANEVTLEMDERGLVIILSDEILFDSGKAEVRKEAYPVLSDVADILKTKVKDKDIGVYGHTDNVPITHSGWKSNWELSTTRATNVLHYLEKDGISPKRLSATGYGEHRPFASNATAEGRKKNRRVEIVILPEFTEKRETGIQEQESDIK